MMRRKYETVEYRRALWCMIFIISLVYCLQDSEIPFIDTKQLPDADGFIFGYPTRSRFCSRQLKVGLNYTLKLLVFPKI